MFVQQDVLIQFCKTGPRDQGDVYFGLGSEHGADHRHRQGHIAHSGETQDNKMCRLVHSGFTLIEYRVQAGIVVHLHLAVNFDAAGAGSNFFHQFIETASHIDFLLAQNSQA